jgi:hypothetical protein
LLSAAVDQQTPVVFRAVQVEIHHLSVALFLLHQAVAAAVELLAVMVLTAVQAAAQDTHQHQVDLVTQEVIHHQKEATAAARVQLQDFMQPAAAVV